MCHHATGFESAKMTERTLTHGQQKRSGKRAPHGSPAFPSRLGAWVTEEQYQYFHSKGGSIWLRQLLDREISSSTVKERK